MSQKYGLTTQEAEASRAQYGRNELSRPPKETFWQKFAANLKDPMIRILTAALVINIIFVYTGHGDWLETVGIFLAILLATLVSTYSEYANENAFQKLQEEASRIFCKVYRDGEPQEVGIADIVKGDAIILQAGDKVPADGVMLGGTRWTSPSSTGKVKKLLRFRGILPLSLTRKKSIFSRPMPSTAVPSSLRVKALCGLTALGICPFMEN